jgi:hypothetical protein
MYFDNHSPSMLTWLIDPCLDPIAQDQIYGNIYLQLLIFSLKTVFGDDEWMKSDEKIASLNNAASSTLAGSIRWWPCEGDRPESWSNHNNATCLGSRLQYRHEW